MLVNFCAFVLPPKVGQVGGLKDVSPLKLISVLIPAAEYFQTLCG